MPKKQIKKEANTPDSNDTSFGTSFLGFKKSQVNLYIMSIKKTLVETQTKLQELQSNFDRLNARQSESGNALNEYEQRIEDLNERLKSEKEASATIEKECMRLQSELDNYSLKLAQNLPAGSLEFDESKRNEVFSKALNNKLRIVVESIEDIMNEFSGDENKLDIGISTPDSELSQKKTNVITSKTDSEPEDHTNSKQSKLEKPVITDDFEGMLKDFSKEFSVKGDDLIAENPLKTEKGDNLIAKNPLEIDKGSDLQDDLFEIKLANSDSSESDISYDIESGGSLDRLGFSGPVGLDDLEEDDDMNYMVSSSLDEELDASL